MRLTVAIPTFDRNAMLARNLALLLPQAPPEIEILLIDNHSPRPIAEDLAPLLAAHPGADVRLVRNAHNIGGNANILRCFELAQAPWIWVLSDDDPVAPDAIRTVLSEIDAAPEAAFVQFYLPDFRSPARPDRTRTEGLADFMARIDSFGASTFISTCLYQRARVMPHMRWAYQFAYSNLPHMALLLSALEKGAVAVLSPASVLAEVFLHERADERESRYSTVYLSIAFPVLLELPTLSPDSRARLAARLGEVLRSLYRSSLYDFLDRLRARDATCRPQHRLLLERSRHVDRWFAWRPLVLAGRLLIGVPALGRAAIRAHQRRKGTGDAAPSARTSMERF